MKNKIEEQVLKLIDEIDNLLESETHMPGTSWKTTSGKTATKDGAGKTTYRTDSPASNYDALKKDRRKKPEGWKSASDASYRTDTKTNESAPKGRGWEKTVKGMKKHKDISNPFALANWMKKKGYKPKTNEEIKSSTSSIHHAPMDTDHSGKIDKHEIELDLKAREADLAATDPSSKHYQQLQKTIQNLKNRLMKMSSATQTECSTATKKNGKFGKRVNLVKTLHKLK